MKPGGGKLKGNQFEREICKALSLWISDGKKADVFWRSAMSGGRATVARRRGVKLANQLGDISAIDPIGAPFLEQFVVECKYYRDLKLQTLFTGKKGGLYEFWEQVVEIAVAAEKNPMLIFKQNGIPPYLMVREEDVSWFGYPKWPGESSPQWRWLETPSLSDAPFTVVVMAFDSFVKDAVFCSGGRT